MDKRDAEIDVLHESVSNITSKVDKTVELIQQKPKSDVRRKNTGRRHQERKHDQVIPEAEILQVDGPEPISNIQVESRQIQSVQNGLSNFPNTSVANSSKGNEQRQNISINTESEIMGRPNIMASDTASASHELKPNVSLSHQTSSPVDVLDQSVLNRNTQSHVSEQNISHLKQAKKPNILVLRHSKSNERDQRTSRSTPVHQHQTSLSHRKHQHHLPAVIKDSFGFRCRLTQEGDDNRRVYLTENHNSGVENKATETGNVTKYQEHLANFSTGIYYLSI